MIHISRNGGWTWFPLALLVSACGGGSEGGGTTLPQQGNDLELRFDQGNLADNTVSISNIEGVMDLRDDLDLGWLILDEYQAAIESLTGWDAGQYPCPESGTLALEQTAEDTLVGQESRFTNCVVETPTFGPVMLDGTINFQTRLLESTEASTTSDGFIRYDLSGTMRGSGEQLRFSGGVRWNNYRHESGEVVTERTSRYADALEMVIGNRYVAIADAQNQASGTDIGGEYSVRATIVGSAIGGYLRLETDEAVELSPSFTCPISGVVKVTSDGEAEIRFGSSAGGTAEAIAVWVDGKIVSRYDQCSEIGTVLYF